MILGRRRFLAAAGSAAALGPVSLAHAAEMLAGKSVAADLSPGLASGVSSIAALIGPEGKRPLIRLADRPPNYETPIEYFGQEFTPNDAFFVRYHLADIPDLA